jgi:rRNA maturation endonuclease Nob1
MKHWWCMGCETEVRLGKHGQCEVCGSEAVDFLAGAEDLSPSGSVRKAEKKRVQA